MACCETWKPRRRQVEYPDNAGFMTAAYIVTAIIVLVYAASLFFRLRKHR